MPETYLYLLSLQCINLVVEGFSSVVTPVYAGVLPLRSSLAKAKEGVADGLVGSEPDEVRVTKRMMEVGWPAILAALSFFLGRNLSDDVRFSLFDRVGGLRVLIFCVCDFVALLGHVGFTS